MLIHFVFIPVIVYTLGIFTVKNFALHDLPVEVPYIGDRVSVIVWVLGCLLGSYLVIDLPVGIVAVAWMLPTCMHAHDQVLRYSDADYYGYTQMEFMLYLHVIAWIAQFMGHYFFEERSPALLSNLAFALLAPFFITFETMNYLFGYQEGDRMRRLQYFIDQDIVLNNEEKSA